MRTYLVSLIHRSSVVPGTEIGMMLPSLAGGPDRADPACRPGSIGEGARFLNRQLSNRLFGKTGGLDQLFEFLSVLEYKVCTPNP